jgi:hypothetical protein
MKLKNAWIALVILLGLSAAHAQVTGSGTTDFVPLWTGTASLGNSGIFQKGANVGIGTKTPSTKLDVVASSPSNAVITGTNTSSTTTSSPVGVLGVSSAQLGIGVFGQATATTSSSSTNNAFGVLGIVDSPFGAGVAGTASSAASSANASGVSGRADTQYGSGGYFFSTSTVGGTGVTGVSMNPSGAGVYGEAMSTAGGAAGVFGQTAAESGAGIGGSSTSATGNGSGVYAQVASPNATAAVLVNNGSGNLVIGQVGSTSSQVSVFRVDGTGKGFFDGGTQTGGADFAESIAASPERVPYQPGDLLAIDPTANRRLTLASEPYSSLVAGIYSTKPGVLATPHGMDEVASNEIPLAIVGIVPCKVSAENGPIQPGDLLVTSSTPGHAMKGTDRARMLGAVVGKALEPLSGRTGVIQVLVTLQ